MLNHLSTFTAAQRELRNYRAILTYHPDVGTFRGERGAWRVALCYFAGGVPAPARPYVTCGINYAQPGRGRGALFMDVARRLRKGTWVNPTKLLRELLAQRRGSTSTTSKE